MKRRSALSIFGLGSAMAPVSGVAAARSFALVWRDAFASHWQDTKEYTLAVLDAMPADGFSLKPNPVQRDFGDQMRHLASANVAYFRAFGVAPLPEGLPADREKIANISTTDKDAIRRYVSASFDYVAAVLAKLTEKDLERTDVNMWKGAKPHSAIDVCLRAYMHTAHHRGQAVVYLRVKGIAPPAWKFEPSAG